MQSVTVTNHKAHEGPEEWFNPSVPSKLNELAILIGARAWTARYAWYVHHRAPLNDVESASWAGVASVLRLSPTAAPA